ncbi:unnamed protein product [Caenorhabditis sp. 36 PRJEB53466]|nr:unnamed protein product [Caenorhabditis sp. 36 PRJEB53466]
MKHIDNLYLEVVGTSVLFAQRGGFQVCRRTGLLRKAAHDAEMNCCLHIPTEKSDCKMVLEQDSQAQLVAEVLSSGGDGSGGVHPVHHGGGGGSSVGIIIGKQGDTIKRLAMETGTKIQFKPDEPEHPEKCAVIMGTRDQIYLTTERITELVRRSAQQQEGGGGGGMSANESFYMSVPAANCEVRAKRWEYHKPSHSSTIPSKMNAKFLLCVLALVMCSIVQEASAQVYGYASYPSYYGG